MNTFHKYNAFVTRVVDGDTIDATVDLGFKIKMDVRFRMIGYDAPETYRPTSPEEKEAGLLATAALKTMIEHKEVIIQSDKFGKYRYLGTVFSLDNLELSVNDKMIRLGHVKP